MTVGWMDGGVVTSQRTDKKVGQQQHGRRGNWPCGFLGGNLAGTDGTGWTRWELLERYFGKLPLQSLER